MCILCNLYLSIAQITSWGNSNIWLIWPFLYSDTTQGRTEVPARAYIFCNLAWICILVQVFATLLNWEKFSVRIAEKDMDNTPEILMKIPTKRWVYHFPWEIMFRKLKGAHLYPASKLNPSNEALPSTRYNVFLPDAAISAVGQWSHVIRSGQ